MHGNCISGQGGPFVMCTGCCDAAVELVQQVISVMPSASSDLLCVTVNECLPLQSMVMSLQLHPAFAGQTLGTAAITFHLMPHQAQAMYVLR